MKKSKHGNTAVSKTATQLRDKMPVLLVAAVVIAGLVVVGWKFLGSDTRNGAVLVALPELSTTARAGKAIFDDNCAQCHGQDGTGGKENGKASEA